MKTRHALAALALGALLTAPPAAASAVFVGPFAFAFDSATCSAALLNPPGYVEVHLTGASGIVNGAPVSSAAVVMLLNNAPPAGYRFCENGPSGFRTYGDGSGVIVAS